ncbi:MAG: kelch motif-containing protein [Chloroflexi bacterium]|nr:kelch motif-containing protein [Chloroflexota bacterium]
MTQALPAGTPIRRRRALMGLLDADGWAWAGVKSAIWFVIIILLLGYIPDRAYYFTVNRTIDVGLLAWSPVNFCPAENKTLPCPAPVGSVIPWEASPSQLSLPEPRTHAAVAQLGTRLLVVGGSNGTAATTTTYIAELKGGTFGSWSAGPALPEARMGASIVVIGSSAFLLGGSNGDGEPTNTVWALAVNTETSELGTWATVEGITLPEARVGAAGLAVSDGLVMAGGRGPDGAPAATVWKADVDSQGALKAFEAQQPLLVAVADATIAQVGDYLWLYGGSDANGPVGAVQRGHLDVEPTPQTPAPNATPAPLKLLQWAVADAYNLPAARTAAAGFAANGTLYVVGGSDGSGPRAELYWTVPNGDGSLPGWKHLDETDLPAGLEGGSAVLSGSNVIVIGGTTRDETLASSIRANLAPQEPFFQAGLVGVVIPALKIGDEVGQQLGYLAAAGAATVNFVILLLLGWAWAHPERVRGWVERRRARRRGRST